MIADEFVMLLADAVELLNEACPERQGELWRVKVTGGDIVREYAGLGHPADGNWSEVTPS